MSLIPRNPGPGWINAILLIILYFKKAFNCKPSQQRKSFIFTNSKIFFYHHDNCKVFKIQRKLYVDTQ